MRNDRLRTAMLERGISPTDLAAAIQVDPKSVERWIKGRTPYRRHRYAMATFLGLDETYLWPDALSPDEVASASNSEIVNVYPHRWTVPSDLWRNHFDRAASEIDLLVYSGLFLAEDVGVQRVLKRKAGEGVTIRVGLGDPHSVPVAERGTDEGIDDTMAAKIRNALVLYKPLRGLKNIEFRLHRTVLYNSIYRADDHVLVNTHIYSFPASQAPVLHLRRIAGGDMVNTYLESFDRVWDGATPLERD